MAVECDNAKLTYTDRGGDPLLSLNCKLLLNIPDLLNAMLLYQEAEEAQLRSNKKTRRGVPAVPANPSLKCGGWDGLPCAPCATTGEAAVQTETPTQLIAQPVQRQWTVLEDDALKRLPIHPRTPNQLVGKEPTTVSDDELSARTIKAEELLAKLLRESPAMADDARAISEVAVSAAARDTARGVNPARLPVPASPSWTRSGGAAGVNKECRQQ